MHYLCIVIASGLGRTLLLRSLGKETTPPSSAPIIQPAKKNATALAQTSAVATGFALDVARLRLRLIDGVRAVSS